MSRDGLGSEQAITDAAELALLTAALPAALRRDNTGGGGPRAFRPSIPVNQDVLECTRTLTHGMRRAESQLRKHMQYAQLFGDRLIEDICEAWPGYVRLLESRRDPVAAQAVADLSTWLRSVRRVLGLSVPAVRLGQHCCPACEHQVPLLVLGAEGMLVQRAGCWQVDWAHAEKIICPGCQASWSRAEWPLLGQLLGVDPEVASRSATAAVIARRLGLPSATVRRWAGEQRIIPVGRDLNGWPLYDTAMVTDVATALGRMSPAGVQ